MSKGMFRAKIFWMKLFIGLMCAVLGVSYYMKARARSSSDECSQVARFINLVTLTRQTIRGLDTLYTLSPRSSHLSLKSDEVDKQLVLLGKDARSQQQLDVVRDLRKLQTDVRSCSALIGTEQERCSKTIHADTLAALNAEAWLNSDISTCGERGTIPSK